MQTMPHPQLAPILLLTRPEAAARRFLAQLELPVQTLIAPLLRIDLLDPGLVGAGLTGLVLSSENGARAAGRIAGLPALAYCVGERTAEAAREAGFAPVCAYGDAKALIALILAQHETGPLLHIRGEHVRGNVSKRLNAACVPTQELVGYRQQSLPLSPQAVDVLAGARPVILPLFSPRTVTILAEAGPFTAPLHVVPISAAVAELARGLRPQSMLQAESPDAMAMVRAVRASLSAVTSG